MGDFTFSKSKFSKLRQAQDAVRAAGLKLALTISPFVSVDSANFKRGVMEGLFVMERNSTSPRGTPALTWFKDVPVAALLVDGLGRSLVQLARVDAHAPIHGQVAEGGRGWVRRAAT